MLKYIQFVSKPKPLSIFIFSFGKYVILLAVTSSWVVEFQNIYSQTNEYLYKYVVEHIQSVEPVNFGLDYKRNIETLTSYVLMIHFVVSPVNNKILLVYSHECLKSLIIVIII